ncbi:aldehyde dehydrogenase [Aeromicrobium sp. Marseille-Q0843]|uniref:Aldehyde dehydrogenase n=1 Tax=Aeromicrobium phoceense TaxID=2754045 RepID=A0A838XEH1_9ACTN|nr:aldehyde dehydrogenase family protein [Aeromicrobium phoceense]MBA4609869.1 aldehyde dehydrogenase [Aeromicrobium phoceense]
MTMTRLDPHDGSHLGDVAVSDLDAVIAAVRRARAAFGAWSTTAPADRGAALHAAADALETRLDEIADLNHRETGKTPGDSRGGAEAGIGTLRQYAELGPVHRGRALQGSFTAIDYAIPRPRGVVVAITPWNDPVAIACGLLGAALVTGNAVVHKPSERCPHLGELLGSILAPCFPEGVLQTVSGDHTTGRALTEQADVDLVAHVGSTAAGRAIEQAAALHDTKVIRENGGNDPLVIDRDVDPAWAAEQAALGAYANGGQICTSVERIYVHRDLAQAFTAELVKATEARNESGELPPLVDTAMRDAVHGQVADAIQQGATVEAGGEVPSGPGAFYPATVLTNVEDSMAVMAEETFGPVAPVCVVEDFEEGLRRAAATSYGLAATVLTGSMDHAQRAAATLPVGTVKVNAVFGGAPGGAAEPRGASGHGYGYGPELLDEMTQTTVVHLAPPRAQA